MKQSLRLNSYRIQKDSLSAYLDPLRLDIDYFTNWPNQSGKVLRNIVGTHIKIIILKEGFCEFEFQNRRYQLHGGDCLIITTYNVYSAITGEAPLNSYELFFNVYPITREQELLTQLKIDSVLLFANLITEFEWQSFSHCYASLQAGQAGSYAQLKANLNLLLIKILRRQPSLEKVPRTRIKEQTVVNNVLIYLNDHLSEPIHVDELCSTLALSQSYLYRCSRNVMNCSTAQLIIRHKLTRAKQLLKDPELSVQNVAELIGYDPLYFSSQFKKYFLLSPTQYRKQHFPNHEQDPLISQ